MMELIVDFPQVCQLVPSSSPNKNKRRQRSSVSFAENSLLQYVDAHENKRDLFYSKHELAVLCEHNRQLSFGINDPCMLAKISEVESVWARKRARIIGLLHFDDCGDPPYG